MPDGLVDRLAASSGSQNSVDAAAATESDTKQALQAARDFAVRESALLVEFDDGGLGVRSQLGGGGAEGVGGLQGMASLNPAVALTALADVDVELAVNGLARNLHLELLGNVGFVEGSAAIGTDVRQGRLVDFVDLFWGRWLAVCLGAIVLARLAARLARIKLGLALGEGSGLALAGAGSFVELTAEAFVLGLKLVDPSPEGLAVGTPN
jgi:hypothetical protein